MTHREVTVRLPVGPVARAWLVASLERAYATEAARARILRHEGVTLSAAHCEEAAEAIATLVSDVAATIGEAPSFPRPIGFPVMSAGRVLMLMDGADGPVHLTPKETS